MKLVVNIKLKPTAEQAQILRETLSCANAACNSLSERGFQAKVLRQYDLHKLAYHETKKKFHLTAQVVVRCIAKVADAYKVSKKTIHRFRSDAAQPYDDRILRFAKGDLVSLATVAGRQKIPFVMGDYQRRLFAHRKGEIDLMRINGKFFLACVCDIDDPKLIKTREVLGVDLGIVNLASDSDGKTYSGKAINRNRCKFSHPRGNL